MNWDNGILITCGSSGLVFLIALLVSKKWPPRAINDLYGYRTTRSKRSQEAWDFAQEYSNKRMREVIVFLFLFGFLGMTIPVSAIVGISISTGFLIGTTIYLFIKTEKALKEKFGE